jgi:organic radical activating enzyme
LIRIKGIWHERTEDAPFVGALVSAVDCHYMCQNCFNQHIKEYKTIERTALDIVIDVINNKFNEGIILAGLEWTLQPLEMEELIHISLEHHLKIILYTGMKEIDFSLQFAQLYVLPIYVKFGRYVEELSDNNYFSYGVKLASTNQYIKWLGSG